MDEKLLTMLKQNQQPLSLEHEPTQAATETKPASAREEFYALLNRHYHTLSTNFVQDAEKLIDKYHGKG